MRELPHLCSTAWEGMDSGGLLDGRSRLSRGGDPVYHYCFLSSFAERAVVPASCCVPIPRDVPFEIAALVGCAITTGTGAVWRTAGVRPGDRVCVIGCGGVGMSAVLGAVAVAAEPIVAVDLDEAKLEAALALGATHAVRWSDSAEDTAERVRAVSGGGVDYAFEATGRTEAGLAAFLCTRARGAAVMIGIPAADAELPLPALQIPRLERRVLGSLYGSARPDRDFPALLALYRRGRLPLERLVARRLPLEAVQEAFDILRGGTALRVVLDTNGGA
jgi:Zn-dependent alcohol dehydrogenase